MKRVLVLQHEAEAPLGRLQPAMNNAEVSPVVVRVDLGEPIPALAGLDGLIVLGGEMGAYDENRFPFLIEEKALVREAVDAGLPVLGICLGSQLLADALGGAAFLADRPEIGVVPVELTAAGRSHRVLSHVGERIFTVHQDTFTLPPGATLLAYTDRFPQAFSWGSALAIQFHPEADAAIGSGWSGAIVDRGGITGGQLAAQLEEWDERLDDDAARLFGAWLGGL